MASIDRVYYVMDRDGDYVEDEDGESRYTDRDIAEDWCQSHSESGGHGPYGIAVRVPGPGGFQEWRACSVYMDGTRIWTTDVYEREMVSA